VLKIFVSAQISTLRTLISPDRCLAIGDDSQSRNNHRVGGPRDGTVTKRAGPISPTMSLSTCLKIGTWRIGKRTLVCIELAFYGHSRHYAHARQRTDQYRCSSYLRCD
jgi:hypothetical protein